MPPVPFKLHGRLPRPLTVKETAEKFGVSMSVVEAARRILEQKRSSKHRIASSKTNGYGRSAPVKSRKTKRRSNRKLTA